VMSVDIVTGTQTETCHRYTWLNKGQRNLELAKGDIAQGVHLGPILEKGRS